MIFLPIVARELRVSARRKTTFTIRSIVAMLGIVIGGFLLLMTDFSSPTGRQGAMVFLTITWYTAGIALLGGIFLASDCLSEERREGTLGFLFLTDLKGYDIVLGKFAAVSLNAFYGMLAVFPILALSFLAGGVTGGEFWRTCLALVNTLFFSVAFSMLVSAFCKSSHRAMSLALCLLIALLLLAFVAPRTLSSFAKLGPPLFCLGALSPMTSVQLASAAGYLYRAREFWISLGICHGAAWIFLAVASWRLTFFREKGEAAGASRNIDAAPAQGRKSERRSQLLDVSPVLWLLDDSRRLRWTVWGIAIVGAVALLTVKLPGKSSPMFSGYLASPFWFSLKIFFAIHSCRFFSETRRTGALELLCSTPMTMRSMISGQWMALRRIFLWPVIILVLTQSSSWFLSGEASFFPFSRAGNGFMSLLALYQVAKYVADFFAIGWFGMWLGLSRQKPSSAAGWTILYVMVLPGILPCVPTLLTDAVFIAIGYSKLRQDFRGHVLGWAASRPA